MRRLRRHAFFHQCRALRHPRGARRPTVGIPSRHYLIVLPAREEEEEEAKEKEGDLFFPSLLLDLCPTSSSRRDIAAYIDETRGYRDVSLTNDEPLTRNTQVTICPPFSRAFIHLLSFFNPPSRRSPSEKSPRRIVPYYHLPAYVESHGWE